MSKKIINTFFQASRPTILQVVQSTGSKVIEVKRRISRAKRSIVAQR